MYSLAESKVAPPDLAGSRISTGKFQDHGTVMTGQNYGAYLSHHRKPGWGDSQSHGLI